MSEEKFREWNYREDLKVRYSSGSGEKLLWQMNQEALLNKLTSIVEQYQDHEIILTNRQLYYQLVALNLIPNADEVYKRICKFITDARYAGLIDWDALEDRGRVPTKPSDWENIEALIRSACYSYRLPRWQDQDYYVELYCEKQAMESVLKPVAEKYHIYFGCNKGYSSASTIYELSKRLKEQILKEKSTIILYLGDHDPSGLDMIRDIRERICEFLTQGEKPVQPDFAIIPLALNMEQIKRYNPPPNPAKITDPRAAWYISQYGKTSWELDALKPEVLIALTDRGIRAYLDIDKYSAWIKLEQKQKKALENFGKKLSKKRVG